LGNLPNECILVLFGEPAKPRNCSLISQISQPLDNPFTDTPRFGVAAAAQEQ
jgi:hypothetical protein